MTMLSVNVNKIATLRNSRGKNTPDVLKTTLDIEKFGAQGITVHPRPDGRHIRRDDVYAIKERIHVEFNIEGYPSPDFLEMVKEVKPAQCTLVPDPPEALTSNAGWKVAENRDLLQKVVAELHQAGVRVSIFVDPYGLTDADYQALTQVKTDRVELYTEAYADAYPTAKRDEVTAVYRRAAERVHALGIGLNAGHDLSLENLRHLIQEIPMIDEVSIGHALVGDALYLGLQETIRRYLECLR